MVAMDIALEVMDFLDNKINSETTQCEIEVLEILKEMIDDKYDAIIYE